MLCVRSLLFDTLAMIQRDRMFHKGESFVCGIRMSNSACPSDGAPADRASPGENPISSQVRLLVVLIGS